MAEYKIENQSSEASKNPLPKGPSLARVVAHTDSTVMGGLRVCLVKSDADECGEHLQTFPVRYASPFFGATSVAFTGQNTGNSAAYNDTQKSYGMTFIPPDIGVLVLCIFLEETGEGFWFGCVPDTYINNMVPGIALSNNTDMSPEEMKNYGGGPLPVAEFNKSLNKGKTLANVDTIKKPVHPIAGHMAEQGLLKDYFRGPVTSSMRRSLVPSVFGILSPGPLDRRANAKQAKKGTNASTDKASPVSRVGGTQFIMDDGDDTFVRATHPSDGGPEYVKQGSGGDVRIPLGECFRIRTRTGHQILLHNSEDLIYIGNSRGTTWIEMTSDGKLDIFAQDSVSIHTKQDFNFRADRDVNIEAGRNINLKAAGDHIDGTGRLQIESFDDYNLIVGRDHKVNITGSLETTIGKDSISDVSGSFNVTSTGALKLTATGAIHTKSSASVHIQAGGDTNILSAGKHIEQANRIEMNCDPATPADAAEAISKLPVELTTHQIDVTDGELDWVATEYQSTEQLKSIMKRVPMHEPWYHHENLEPLESAFDKTDREV